MKFKKLVAGLSAAITIISSLSFSSFASDNVTKPFYPGLYYRGFSEWDERLADSSLICINLYQIKEDEKKGAEGYDIEYYDAKSKKWKNLHTCSEMYPTSFSTRVLKPDTTYKLRIRFFKTVNGKKKIVNTLKGYTITTDTDERPIVHRQLEDGNKTRISVSVKGDWEGFEVIKEHINYRYETYGVGINSYSEQVNLDKKILILGSATFEKGWCSVSNDKIHYNINAEYDEVCGNKWEIGEYYEDKEKGCDCINGYEETVYVRAYKYVNGKKVYSKLSDSFLKAYVREFFAEKAVCGEQKLTNSAKDNKIIKKIFNNLFDEKMTSSQKAMVLLEYVRAHGQYEYDYSKINSDPIQALFVEGKGQCYQWAKSYEILMKCAGFDNIKTVGGTKNGKNHWWNEMIIDGKTYLIDPYPVGLFSPGWAFISKYEESIDVYGRYYVKTTG